MPRSAFTRPSSRRPALTACVSGLLAAALLAACASDGASTDDGDTSATSPASSASATEEATTPTYAFSADNCGFEVTRDTPPTAIVAVKSAMTELVLALGAGDRLVGLAYQDGPVPQEYTELVAALPVLADRVPTNEAVLSVEPDLVLAGWESVFSADGAGERQALTDLGVTTFVAPAACTQAPYLPDPLTFDDVFAEITAVGDLLGTPEEAAALVEEQRAELAAAIDGAATVSGDAAEPPTALWWSSGSDTPYVGAGTGAPQMIMNAVGLRNIAADLEGGWGPYSWEAAAAANPDVIVLVDSSWNSAEKKKETLAANPVTAAIPAVAEGRFLVVPFAATEAGVRNVEAVVTLSDQLAALNAAG